MGRMYVGIMCIKRDIETRITDDRNITISSIVVLLFCLVLYDVGTKYKRILNCIKTIDISPC